MADSVDEDPLPRISRTISYTYAQKRLRRQSNQPNGDSNAQCVISSLRNGARTCAYQLLLTAQDLDW